MPGYAEKPSLLLENVPEEARAALESTVWQMRQGFELHPQYTRFLVEWDLVSAARVLIGFTEKDLYLFFHPQPIAQEEQSEVLPQLPLLDDAVENS